MAKKVGKAFSFEYILKGNRETVLWGPKKSILELVKKEDVGIDDLSDYVTISKREKGSFEKDYNELLNDISSKNIFYKKLNRYITKYYIPLSRGEKIRGDYNDDPFEFLEYVKHSSNIIYSYIGHKIDYYIRNEYELPVSVLDEFIYGEGLHEICLNSSEGEEIFKKNITLEEASIGIAKARCKNIQKKNEVYRKFIDEINNLVSSVDKISKRIDSLIKAIYGLREEE